MVLLQLRLSFYRVVFWELYQMIMKDVQIITKFGKPLFSAKIAFFFGKVNYFGEMVNFS